MMMEQQLVPTKATATTSNDGSTPSNDNTRSTDDNSEDSMIAFVEDVCGDNDNNRNQNNNMPNYHDSRNDAENYDAVAVSLRRRHHPWTVTPVIKGTAFEDIRDHINDSNHNNNSDNCNVNTAQDSVDSVHEQDDIDCVVKGEGVRNTRAKTDPPSTAPDSFDIVRDNEEADENKNSDEKDHVVDCEVVGNTRKKLDPPTTAPDSFDSVRDSEEEDESDSSDDSISIVKDEGVRNTQQKVDPPSRSTCNYNDIYYHNIQHNQTQNTNSNYSRNNSYVEKSTTPLLTSTATTTINDDIDDCNNNDYSNDNNIAAPVEIDTAATASTVRQLTVRHRSFRHRKVAAPQWSSPPSCPARINTSCTDPPIDTVTVHRNVRSDQQQRQQEQHQQEQSRLPIDPLSRSPRGIATKDGPSYKDQLQDMRSTGIRKSVPKMPSVTDVTTVNRDNDNGPSYKDQLRGGPRRMRNSAPAAFTVSDLTAMSSRNDNGTAESRATSAAVAGPNGGRGIVVGGGGSGEYKCPEVIEEEEEDGSDRRVVVPEDDDSKMMTSTQYATFIGLANAESARRLNYAEAIIAPCIVLDENEYDNNGNYVNSYNNDNNRNVELQQQRRQHVSASELSYRSNNSSGGMNASNELLFSESPLSLLSSDVVPNIFRSNQNVSSDIGYDNNIVGTTITTTRLRESASSSTTSKEGVASTRSSLLGSQYLRDSVRSTIMKSNSTNNINNHKNDMTLYHINELKQKNFPFGLCQQLQTTKALFPIRFWIIDNSGSMMSPDGHRCVVQPADGHSRNKQQSSCMQVPCSRWKELQSTLEFHTWFAGMFEIPTVFRLLNDPGGARIGPQEFIVSNMEERIQGDAVLSHVHPEGTSNLATHLCVIHDHIASVQSLLLGQGQKAVVIVATDGLPTDQFGNSDDATKGDFISALKKIQLLPVWIVIRLCTDDETVLNFYRSLDVDLELGMEVLDDYINEAKKIHKTNCWLNYSAPFQRCREMGCDKRIYDLLNERLLTRDELHDFFAVLFGYDVMNAPTAPNIYTSSWKEFSHFIKTLVEAEAKQWNPISKRMEYIVDMKKLNRCYNQHHSIASNAGKKLFGRLLDKQR